MSAAFVRKPHPHIAERKKGSKTDAKVGLNDRIATLVTGAVGTMWCAYAFAIRPSSPCPRRSRQATHSRSSSGSARRSSNWSC